MSWFVQQILHIAFCSSNRKITIPRGYLLNDASLDQPFEEDACRCHFSFVQDNTLSVDSQLLLKYQWFMGERMLSNFVAIPDATGEVIDSCININALNSFFFFFLRKIDDTE